MGSGLKGLKGFNPVSNLMSLQFSKEGKKIFCLRSGHQSSLNQCSAIAEGSQFRKSAKASATLDFFKSGSE